MCSAFWTIFSPSMVYFLTQKLVNSSKVTSQCIWWTFHASYHPQSSDTVEHLNNFLNNKLRKKLWAYLPHLPLICTLSKADWSMNVAVSRKGASPLVCFLGDDQNERKGSYTDTFWKSRILPWPFLGIMHLSFPLIAIQSGQYTLQVAAQPKGAFGDSN